MNHSGMLAAPAGIFAAFGLLTFLIEIALAIVVIAGCWKVFTKAGQPGWAAIIPIYNLIVLLQITGKPLWWIILFFIPCVNIVMIILVDVALARAFGKDVVYAIGLFLLPFIFFPILGFGDAKYVGPAEPASS
jgi:hypothetical protein